MHKFQDSLTVGQEYEKFLDTVFSRWYTIEEVSLDMQRLGVDRIFVQENSGKRWSVEYKTDVRCGETGNFAIETALFSDDGELRKHGWAVTSTAQLVVFYVPAKKQIYIVDMVKLRDRLEHWSHECKTFTAQNEGYYGVGLLVPEDEIEYMSRGQLTHE